VELGRGEGSTGGYFDPKRYNKSIGIAGNYDRKYNEYYKYDDEVPTRFLWMEDDDWEKEFYSGNHETFTIKREDGLYEMIKGENDTFTIDHEGMKKVNDRIQNGLRLFAKHYRGLWD
jgi:hypothetical protein